MSAQTLNIIYDTNYTSIINGWGFVDNQFTWKKAWFFSLLFWDLSKKPEDSKNNTNSSAPSSIQENESQDQSKLEVNSQENQEKNQQNGAKQEKSPWFFDLLGISQNESLRNTSKWESVNRLTASSRNWKSWKGDR